jgi:DNA-binding MarR family transcriptional regulator
MKQVQLATGLSTRGFYLIVKKLEQSNLVVTTDALDDKRKRLLSLTPQGLVSVERMPASD